LLVEQILKRANNSAQNFKQYNEQSFILEIIERAANKFERIATILDYGGGFIAYGRRMMLVFIFKY
jgi:hypothetical protein